MSRFEDCDCCGKHYLRPESSIFKFKYKGRTKKFCCYNCYIKMLKLKENKQYEEIDQILNEAQRKIQEACQS